VRVTGRNPTAPSTRPLRLAHLTTVDMSLALLLGTELAHDRAAGHEVFGISAPGPYVPRVEALGVTHVPVPAFTRSWNLTRDARAFRQLLRTLRTLELDVLHTHTPKAGVMGRIAGRLAGVPVVVNTCHGLWARPEDPLLKRALVYGAEGLAAQFSDAELFQNAQDRTTLRPFLGGRLASVVGNGVDLERFHPDPAARARVRAELGVGEDELLVVAVGRQVREKGLAEFSAMAERLAGRARFVWVGPADDTDAAAQSLRSPAVEFPGERTDLPALYAAADVFVLPTYREGFSRSGMEAAATGLPMVLTDIRGCREIGTHGEHLLLVPPRDDDALTTAVGSLLDDDALRARLGAAARSRALAHFDQRAIAQRSLDVYAEVARRKRLDWAPPALSPRALVLHVLPQDLSRGAQAYAGQLRDALAGDPTQEHVVVALFDAPPAALRPDVALGVRSGLLRRAGLDPRAACRLRRLVRRRRPAAVIAHGGEALKYAVAARGRRPVVYYRVGLSAAEIARASRTALYRTLARRATRSVGVSQAVVDQLHTLLGVPTERLALIPNGRDPGVYHPPGPGVRDDAAPPLVLWVGQFERGKRPALFLHVVEAVRARGVELRAAMVGDGPLRASLEARARQLDVELPGRRDDVPSLLRSAAVLVMTSERDSEGMPGALIEAGLTGIPVVATAAAGVADVVADGVTGFVVTSSNPRAIADPLEALLRDPALCADMGAAARERCLTHFTIEATARQWHDLVADLTGSQPQ